MSTLSRRTSAVVGLFGVLTALTVVALPAAAAELTFGAQTSAVISAKTVVDMHGLLPGDRLPDQAITIAATGPVLYRVAPRWTGSSALTRAVSVRMSSRQTGGVLYAGPLESAQAVGRMTDADEIIDISLTVSREAGHDVQGAELAVVWVVTVTDAA